MSLNPTGPTAAFQALLLLQRFTYQSLVSEMYFAAQLSVLLWAARRSWRRRWGSSTLIRCWSRKAIPRAGLGMAQRASRVFRGDAIFCNFGTLVAGVGERKIVQSSFLTFSRWPPIVEFYSVNGGQILRERITSDAHQRRRCLLSLHLMGGI
jgi:hypothetical protein